MKTMAQVQANTLDDSVKRLVIAEQFAEDFTLISDNDYEMYSMIMDTAKAYDSVASLSDVLRSDYEHLIGQVLEVVEDRISPIASSIIGQILNNQGSLPFDFIAAHYLGKDSE